ncbi:response regulator receiver protein [Paraburkholderia sp. LEh10]|uniref:response regulator receiver protein n=1 Tax=Paraburkholderia sp. LEh10 TaxID=2821353 RepID=UPI001AEAB8CA|nr:response regulator receiver protein [Paraburkholderia sp. LEh10]MBP0588553.1 response regulator receiver protein [Paraburkholderia sp. LEh10]
MRNILSPRPQQPDTMGYAAREIGIVPCALVFLADGGIGSPNLRKGDRFSYVAQAVTLNRSLLAARLPRLTIASNAPREISDYLSRFEADLCPTVIPLASSLELPEGTPFYGAHFKLDLLEQMAQTLPEGKLLLLLDTDVIAQHGLDMDLLRRCHASGVGAFDISDQEFFAYGASRVIADLERVAGRSLGNPRWFGGEFLLASREFIDRLVPVARACFDRYRAVIGELHHQGDEAFVSAALNILSDEGQRIIDVGEYRAIGRHWSGNTHRDLRWFRHCALLHLPDCKTLLGREARQRTFSGARVWRRIVVRHQMHRLVWLFRIYVRSR